MESNFDPDWYLSNNVDVSRAGLDPLQHYVKYGKIENRYPRMPKWFFESLSSDGWLKKEFKPEIASIPAEKDISKIRIVRVSKLSESNTIYLQLLSKTIQVKNKYFIVVLINTRNEHMIELIDKEFFKIILLDNSNFKSLTTQIVGSMYTSFILNKNRIKIIKIKSQP
jgi:hypothetical protein